MHEQQLALAALAAPTRIFGLPMRPYSLGHELHLIREDNPILSGDRANVMRHHLAQAVFICSSTFEECRRISSDYLIGIKIALWRWRTRKLDYKKHLDAFLEYRRDGSRCFPPGRQTSGEGGSRIAGAPFIMRLYQFLIIELRVPMIYKDPQSGLLLTPWDYPIGLAQMQFATYWEEKGCYAIYSEVDQIQNEALALLDAEEAAEAAAKKAKEGTCPG